MDAVPFASEMQLTNTPGLNAFAKWGKVLIPGRAPTH